MLTCFIRCLYSWFASYCDKLPFNALCLPSPIHPIMISPSTVSFDMLFTVNVCLMVLLLIFNIALASVTEKPLLLTIMWQRAKCVINAKRVLLGIRGRVVIAPHMFVVGLCKRQAHPGNYCRDLGVVLGLCSSAWTHTHKHTLIHTHTHTLRHTHTHTSTHCLSLCLSHSGWRGDERKCEKWGGEKEEEAFWIFY